MKTRKLISLFIRIYLAFVSIFYMICAMIGGHINFMFWSDTLNDFAGFTVVVIPILIAFIITSGQKK